MKPLIVNVKQEISTQFFSDMLCNCFEGGSNYWIDSVRPLSDKDDGIYSGYYHQYLLVEQDEDLTPIDTRSLKIWSKDEVNILTYKKLCSGYKKYVKWCLDTKRPFYYHAEDLDGSESDIILQFALFKEIRYS